MNFKSLLFAAMIACSGVSVLPAFVPQAAIAAPISADIGWTKAQVEKENGKPSRISGETWYYKQSNGVDFAIHFSGGKVDGFPGARG